MELITISSDPISKLKRKLFYDFTWSQKNKKIIIRCYISHYNINDSHTVTPSISDFVKDLVASDSLVEISTGRILTEEEKKAEGFDPADSKYTTEYDYYANYVGKSEIILPNLIKGLIALRDSEGKFNI